MKINSLHQWYVELDNQSKKVEKYEDTIISFYKFMKKDPNEVGYKPFMKGFYKNNKFGDLILPTILSSLLPSAIISAVIAILSWILFMVSKKINFFQAIKNFGLYYAKTSLIILVGMLIVCVGLAVLFKFLKYKSICKSLEKQEKGIEEILSTLPSNYRTSDKMNLCAQVYYTNQKVAPATTFEAVDKLYPTYGKRPFQSVMFDIPFRNDLIPEEQLEDVKNPNMVEQDTSDTKNNPHLPKDIDTRMKEGSKDSQKDLDAMIGLAPVKDQVAKFENRIKLLGKDSNNGCHMAFLGSAGTGKTTVARIITKILFDLGFIEKNQYLEISGDYLRAGDTERALAIIEYAYGGVLFIDEAYLLYDKNGYGSDATGILLKAMEDHRKDFVCILAGYEEQMTKLIFSNEGFSSRIKHKIYFDDYTVEEMLDLFDYFIKDNKLKLTVNPDARELLVKAFTLEKRFKTFGNARTVRNAVDAIIDNYADRSVSTNNKEKVITYEDVDLYYKDRENEYQHETRNASAADHVDESIIKLAELKPKVFEGSKDPDEDMRHLVGLDSFLDEIQTLKNQKEFYGNEFTAKQQNILFVGPEGCGKTSLVKVLTGYLYQLGYIQDNRYLDISAEFMKGAFVGHTSRRADAIINYASGGVLYIRNLNLINNDMSDGFSQEATSAIITALSQNHNLVIVIADYYSDFIESISNQFNMIYEFPDYTSEQLVEIFKLKAKEDGFDVEQNVIVTLYDKLSTGGTIRDILRIYDNTKKKHISQFTEANKYLIIPEDLVLNGEKKALKLKMKKN